MYNYLVCVFVYVYSIPANTVCVFVIVYSIPANTAIYQSASAVVFVLSVPLLKERVTLTKVGDSFRHFLFLFSWYLV